MSELGYFLAGAVFGLVAGWFVCAYIMGTIIKKEGPEKILEIFKKK
jgi:predicted small secreted protein